jgi:uncharacterized protein (TIGR00290 family)
LYRAIQAGAKPAYLFTMLREDGIRSRSHGIPPSVLEQQSASLGIPLITRQATWDDYEKVFITTLKELNKKGVRKGVFGDIDFEDNRQWEEMVCHKAGIEAFLPIWQTPRRTLIQEFIGEGFEAMIVACNDEKMGKEYLGSLLTMDLIEEFEGLGIDVAGEEGEYHTVVTNGPNFKTPITLIKGKTELYSGYWFLEVNVD